jgi:hypothetical protein
MFKILLLFTTLLFGCKKHEAVETRVKVPSVKEKAEFYISQHKGWAHDKCDSLGFTALCKLAGGCAEANVFDAEGEPGRWYRSPEKDCFDKGESRSDISKDMFAMLFPYLYATGNKEALVRIHEYGRSHMWIMGRYDGTPDGLARVFMAPAMSIFLGEMISKVRDTSAEETADIPVNTGFRAHLDVISWITQGMVRGEISAIDYEMLRVMTEKNPRNALFQAAYHRFKDGNQSRAVEILEDTSLFPSFALPTSNHRCEEYLWQRDDGDDWKPCAGEKTHDGVDYIFAAWVAGQL